MSERRDPIWSQPPRDVPSEAEKLAIERAMEAFEQPDGWMAFQRESVLRALWLAAQIAQAEADAKAGCEYCAGKWSRFNAAPAHDTIRRWVHLAFDPPEGYCGVDCERPEVRDALSKLKESTR